MKKTFFTSLILILICLLSAGQTKSLYIPVTNNASFFVKNSDREFQFATKINNYGLNHSFSAVWKKKILNFSVQYNNGRINFDPLHFNRHPAFQQETHLIQTQPTAMFYAELGFGYQLKFRNHKLSCIVGSGQQFVNKNTRYFIQLNWGNESKLVNVGFSIRTNYALIQNNYLFVAEPVLHGKIKLKRFRIVNQFGYCIPIKSTQNYAKPIITLGLEYIL